MNVSFSDQFSKTKKHLLERSQLRHLRSRQGIDFCSNDYLGLSNNVEIRQSTLHRIDQLALGSTGSRLLRGNNQAIESLESQLAEYSKTESALFFPSGYQANLALFSCLLAENAVVFSDELIHASIIDGIRLARCEKYIWGHNDVKDLESLLRQKAQGDKLNVVVVESLYSMRADQAPLTEISQLCETYGALLIVDEAHSTGLFGEKGAGLVDELGLNSKVFAKIQTAGKALGASGAWVAGSQELKELIVNKSRPFIYSTAPGGPQIASVAVALEYLQKNFDLLKAKFQNQQAALFADLISLARQHDLSLLGEGGPICSLVLKESDKALAVMDKMQEKGFDVRAIRPPSVPAGEALLRMTCPLNRTRQEREDLVVALAKALGDL